MALGCHLDPPEGPPWGVCGPDRPTGLQHFRIRLPGTMLFRIGLLGVNPHCRSIHELGCSTCIISR